MSTSLNWRDRVAGELAATAEQLCGVDISAPGFRERSRAAAAAKAAEADLTGIDVRDKAVSRSVAPDLPVRIYTPRGGSARKPVILHFHGGGFVSGGLDTGHQRLADLSRQIDAVVASVDYRLAPEHRYPAAFEDGRDALLWLHENADLYDLDPARVVLHGISAGGGIAAAVALAARELPIPAPRLQYLSMAVLDDKQSTYSARTFVDTPVWNRANALHAWSAYLGPCADAGELFAAPGRAAIKDLAGVAPAHIAVLELDPTRDEGIEYAQRLLAAGNSVGLALWAGTFHAFMSMAADTEVARRHDAEEARILSAALLEEKERVTGNR